LVSSILSPSLSKISLNYTIESVDGEGHPVSTKIPYQEFSNLYCGRLATFLLGYNILASSSFMAITSFSLYHKDCNFG
jgi:hypothetical protein